MERFVKVVVYVLVSTTLTDAGTRVARLSVADGMKNNYFFNNIRDGAYSFNYDISDRVSGNTQYRTEDRYPNGTVTGGYGYIDAFGNPQRFRYVADQAGYRVFKDNFKPFNPTTMIPLDKLAASTEPEITWSRPKRPNKNFDKGIKKNEQRRVFNLIGPPSLYVPYY